MKILRLIFLVLSFYGNFAAAQTIPSLWEGSLSLPEGRGNLEIEETFPFEAYDLPNQYYLEIKPSGKAPKQTQVWINGKLIACHPLHATMIPIALTDQNSIRIRLKGQGSSGVSARIMGMSVFVPIYGPEEFAKKLLTKLETRTFTAPAVGEYLMKVEPISQKNNWFTNLFSEIEINGVKVLNILDLIVSFNGPVIKVVKLEANNQVKVKSFGLGAFKITFYKGEGSTDAVPSVGSLSFRGLQEGVLNEKVKTSVIDIIGTSLPLGAEVMISVNNDNIPASDIQVVGQTIVVKDLLKNGYNEIEIDVEDSEGRGLSVRKTFWAGKNIFKVTAVSDSGAILPNAHFDFIFLDKERQITIRQDSLDGKLTMINVPDGEMLLTIATDNALGNFRFTVGKDLEFNLVLTEIKPQFPSGASLSRAANLIEGSQLVIGENPLSLVITPFTSAVYNYSNANGVNYQLITGTDTLRVKMPAGARSATLKAHVENVSNGAGAAIGFFAASDFGRTYINPWGVNSSLGETLPPSIPFEKTLSRGFGASDDLVIWGSVVSVNGSSPRVVIDSITFYGLSVDVVDLRDLDNSPINRLSIDKIGGAPVQPVTIPANLRFHPAPGDIVDDLYLQILQSDNVIVGQATVPDKYKSMLQIGQPWVERNLEYSFPFELLPTNVPGVINTSSMLEIRLVIELRSSGAPISVTYDPVDVGAKKIAPLIPLRAVKRYSTDRNISEGGDGWGRNYVVKDIFDIANSDVGKRLNFAVNDISNMHGGYMYPHDSHVKGLSVDCKIDGFSSDTNSPTAEAATNLIAIWDSMTDDQKKNIRRIFVTKNAAFTARLDQLKTDVTVSEQTRKERSKKST